MPDVTTAPVHLTPDDYRVIGPQDFNAPGLSARESIGPFVSIRALGPLLTVHDSRFEADTGIGHHPHQGMERLFYILEGTVDHDDALNNITGHMGTGDLGILTEGRRGMIHSEWNNSDGPARAYIFVYPTDPTPATASFDAVRDADAPRTQPADGVAAKTVIARDSARLRGDVREIVDASLDGGSTVTFEVRADEAALVFVVDGDVRVTVHGTVVPQVGTDHTVLLPPEAHARSVEVVAGVDSRIIRALTGPGYGFQRA